MKVPFFAGKSLSEFLKSAIAVTTHEVGGSKLEVYGCEVERPEGCPQAFCGSDGVLRRNGSYTRQVIEGLRFLIVLIYRFRCGQCGKTVSCPYSFLVPYRRFTAKLICLGVEQYGGDEETTYQDISVDLSVYDRAAEGTAEPPAKPANKEKWMNMKDGLCPARSTVFSWVDFVCKRILKTVQQVEKESVLRSLNLKELPVESQCQNKNAWKAGAKRYPHQKEKPEELDKLTYGLAAASSLIGGGQGRMERLRAYFLQAAERCADLLSDVSMILPITQTPEQPIW